MSTEQGGAHPAPERLERFMRGELPRSEVPAVIRHLLTGCPQCVEVTRRLWNPEDQPWLRILLEEGLAFQALALRIRLGGKEEP